MSMECDILPSLLWHCWLGDRKGIWPVKKLDIGLLMVMIWLELCTTYNSSDPVVTTTSINLCFNKHQLTQVHLKNGRSKRRERESKIIFLINTQLPSFAVVWSCPSVVQWVGLTPGVHPCWVPPPPCQVSVTTCLCCFDSVGWAAGRAYGL